MTKIKNYIAALTLLLSYTVFGQQSPNIINTVVSATASNSSDGISASNNEAPVVVEKPIILTPKEQFDATLEAMQTDAVLKNANWGFVLYDPIAKKIVSSYNETKPLIPASTTKLLTTETALNQFGDKYNWTTQLEYSGEIDENGVLNGNIYIVGSGDISLGTNKAGAASYAVINSGFITAILEKGIKKINGNIIVQTALFKGNITSLPENIVWLDQNNYYLPVGNTRDTKPENERQVVKNSLGNKNRKFFYVSPITKKLVYTDIFDGTSMDAKIPTPPSFLANSLRASLVKSGVAVTGKVVPKTVDQEPEPRKLITSYKSPSLEDIVNYINHKSDNPLSEALLKYLGYINDGNYTTESGRNVVTEHLAKIGFDMEGLNYMDGSGLSRAHTVTPIAQVKFLTYLMKQKHYKTFFESLPTGGQSGTLKRSFLTAGNGQVFAKTGTLNKVKTLAGYIKSNKGKTYVFSLLINNYAGSVDMVKNRMEKILIPVLEL